MPILSEKNFRQIQTQFVHFCQTFPVQKFEPGRIVMEASSSSEYGYYLKKGCIKMSSTSALGDTVTLHVFYPDSFCSLLQLVTDKNAYDLEALTEVEAYKVPLAKVYGFFTEHPTASLWFNFRLLKGMLGLLHRIEQSVFVSAYYQVAGVLHYFSRHVADRSDSPVLTIKITHKDIAEWLGLTRENVSLQMKQLERDGLIARQGKFIKIVNPKELARVSNPQELLL